MIEGREEFRSPGSLLPGGLLYGSSGTQDAFHPVIPLVTRILEERLVAPPHRNLRRKRFRPGRRIAHGEFVKESVRTDARELFDEMHVRAGVRERRGLVEALGLDH